MGLRLREYSFLRPASGAGSAATRSGRVEALAILLFASAGGLVGYAFGALVHGGQFLGLPGSVAFAAAGDTAAVSGASVERTSARPGNEMREDVAALNAENARLVEERKAFQFLYENKSGAGREVSISAVTARPIAGGWRYFALVSGGAQASGPFRGNAVVELAGSVGGSDERVLAEVPARGERLDYRNGQILAGEVTAAEVAATALRILVVDEEGRTRAVQRLALP